MGLTRELYEEKQRLAAPSRYYGDGGTIHGSNEIDVVTDIFGNVKEVWFRCQKLPFNQSRRFKSEFFEDDYALPKITGVEVLDVTD